MKAQRKAIGLEKCHEVSNRKQNFVAGVVVLFALFTFSIVVTFSGNLNF